RLLQRIWRNMVDETTGEIRVDDRPLPENTRRLLHRTIVAVREGMESLRFNIAIARLTELNNHVTTACEGDGVPREVAEPLLLMLAPLAPHISEELWSRLGHTESLAWAPYPVADPALLVDETIEIPVQVNGKVRGTVRVASDADQAEMEAVARADERIAALLADGQIRKVVVVPRRLVNFVVG
ncbi:MAG TPA: class I tRNA ligase family protein, partial [Mycobacteriales bacterium]